MDAMSFVLPNHSVRVLDADPTSWRRRRSTFLATLLVIVSIGCTTSELRGQEAAAHEDDHINKLSEFLSGVKLTGHFTVTGRDLGQLTAEEYYILKAEKLSEGDFWSITARIKYGNNDLTVPLVLDIKWAGNTPVITVDRLTIPGMGTFDARVIIRTDAYAGTWRHDEVGGHLFGTIERLSAEELAELRKSVSQRDNKSP